MSQFQHKEHGYRPCVQQNGGGGGGGDYDDDDAQRRRPPDLDDDDDAASLHGAAVALMSIDQCVMGDAQLVGAPAPPPPPPDAHVAAPPPPPKGGGDATMTDVAVRNEAQTVQVKKRRGRPPRIQGKAGQPPPPPPPQRQTMDEEDVCFICFDGGSLVLCDRRGCPKAYHPACIKRDEAFFRSKAKWNCGWHICSSCQKASHYMCYTCTYSLCKGCTKDADYVCVRGNKGFCGTCMKTILLIENVDTGNKEMVQVDFDDKTSWEYLFKVYWVCLKEKLSLTVDELTKAKNPWKGEELPKAKKFFRNAVALPPREVPSGELHLGTVEKVYCCDNFSGNLESNHSKRRKIQDQPKFPNEGNTLGLDNISIDDFTSSHVRTMWATKELLEFVSHMKNGDVPLLTQFDVQSLLLEYIKRNNLRDPQKICEIVCDSRLINLFGKTRLGHFEMLKLLEDHFLVKEKTPVNDSVRMGVDDAMDTGGNNDSELMIGNERRRKIRRKMDGRGGTQINPNLDDYAAIDVHNIDLIYLKRGLMENLMDDAEKFNEKVVGSFVRIKIPGGDQKQDMHRLVQVVGVSKVAESYEVGTRTADSMLEILNLDKKEVIPIDVISNQEFLEEWMLSSPNENLPIPAPNKFIPADFSPKDSRDEINMPVLLRKSSYATLCYKPDTKFFMTKAYVKTEFNCPHAGISPETKVLTKLFTRLVTDYLNEYGTKGVIFNHPYPSLGSLTWLLNFQWEMCLFGMYLLLCWSLFTICGQMDRAKPYKDECKCLLQNMKCGLIRPLTVGEIQDKAMALKAVKVADWLEAEVLRLNHLRDRASEKGHRKEHRECVEKLELLKSPKECQRRLLEIPDIHTDPCMNPSYESEEDAGESEMKQGGAISRNSGVGRKGLEVSSTLSGGDVVSDTANKAQMSLATNCQQNKDTSTAFYVDRNGTTRFHDRGATSSVTGEHHSEAVAKLESFSGVASTILPSVGREPSVNDTETDTLWHYRDPTGKTQGPFSLVQLGKWSTLGLFPRTLRVWMRNERQDDSILLTDALAGRFHKDVPGVTLLQSSNVQCPEALAASNESLVDNRNADHSQKLVKSDASVCCNGNGELVRSDDRGSHSSSWSLTVDSATDNEGHAQNSLRGKDLLEGTKSSPDQPQIYSSLPCPSIAGKINEALLPQAREGHGDEKLGSQLSNVTGNSTMTIDGQNTIAESDKERADYEKHSNQSSGQNWRPPSLKCFSSGWDGKSDFVSLTESIETSDQRQEIDFSDLLSPIPKANRVDFKGQAAENKQPATSNVPSLHPGPTWITASRLVVDEAQLPEVVLGWGAYSSTPGRPSAEDWDSNLVPAPSLKPTEVANNHAATPASGSLQLMHSSPAHPIIDASSWHPIITEPTEFCSLADESVSDLLAEVEAMESLGLPSPTSKMRCDDLTHSSDNDCFSPVDGFCPTPDPGKSDALSSTGDMQHMSSQLALVDASLQLCLMPSQPTVTNEPLTASQMATQLTLTNEQFVSHTPQSSLTDEPIRLLQTEVLNSRKSFSSGHSSSAEYAKPSDASVNQAEPGSDVQPHTPSTVSQWESGSDVPSMPDPNRGTIKENTSMSRSGVTNGNANTVSRGAVHHSNANSATSAGYPGSWGNQPRHGSDRYSGLRDHRNHFQGKDHGYSRDRNKQPSSYGVGSGGSSYRPAPKGPRVCKFYESGCCKKGASCSYWHP